MSLAAVPQPIAGDRHGSTLILHRSGVFGEVSNVPRQPQSRVNAEVPQCGTPLAIKYLSLGVAALLPCSATGRGGARNSAARQSHELTASHVDNLNRAARHAAAIGLPFTRMVTVHWQAAGVPLDGMAKATGRFTDLLTKALARHGSGTAWLWTHENCGPKGGHCHLLVHVPAALVPLVTGLQRGWLGRITGRPYRARVIRSKPIGRRLGIETGNPEIHSINLDAALSYVLKGASRQAAAKFNLERLEPGGLIIGKRCGTSENIGATARKAKD